MTLELREEEGKSVQDPEECSIVLSELKDAPPSWDEISGDHSVEDQENCSVNSMQSPAPTDRYYMVYGIFLLHGVGMLMSWNMFITIAPQYYRDYWFSYPPVNGSDPLPTSYANSFMSVLGVTSQVPNVGIMFFNAAIVAGGSLILRSAVPLFVNCFLVAAIIIFVIFAHPDDARDNIQWFYIVTLVIIMLMNLANGIYQSSIYGLSADFPDNYINSLVIGNNLCGVFTSLMSIFTTLISPDDIELNALLYFSISLGILIVCFLSLYLLVRLQFYKYYIALGAEARKSENSENLSLNQYLECLTYCWVQLFNNFFVYFVSLMIFPAMNTDIKIYGDGKTSIFGDEMYYNIGTYLNFNIFAFIGSTLANYVQFPSARWLWVPILARVAFVPIFMYCNYLPGERKHEVFFQSEWFPLVALALLALSCGYFSSLALIYTPSGVPTHYQKISGMAASIALMLGILAGVSFTPVIKAITEHW